MEQEPSLSDLLNTDEPNEAPEAQPETVVEEQPAERPRDENGRFAKTGDTSGPPPQAEQREEPVFNKAVLDERRRRQEAEQRAAALEAQIQALQNPPAPPPSVFEDETGFGNHVVQTAIQQATAQASLNAKLDMSEMMVRQANPDFEEVKAEFLRLAEENPTLRQQALADPHPWNKAYQIAKTHRTMQEIGATDIESLKAALRAEIEAERGAIPNAAPRPIPSLTGERSAASRAGPAWSPPSLSELLR